MPTFKQHSFGEEVREDGEYDHHDGEKEHLLHCRPHALFLSHLVDLTLYQSSISCLWVTLSPEKQE